MASYCFASRCNNSGELYHITYSCFICIFNTVRWQCIELRIASASVTEMHTPNTHALTTQVHNSASWHPTQACWYFRGVCFSVLWFQPNADTSEKAKPQQRYKASYISQPLSHWSVAHTLTHKHLLICLKTSRRKQYSQAPWGVSKRSAISRLTAW